MRRAEAPPVLRLSCRPGLAQGRAMVARRLPRKGSFGSEARASPPCRDFSHTHRAANPHSGVGTDNVGKAHAPQTPHRPPAGGQHPCGSLATHAPRQSPRRSLVMTGLCRGQREEDTGGRGDGDKFVRRQEAGRIPPPSLPPEKGEGQIECEARSVPTHRAVPPPIRGRLGGGTPMSVPVVAGQVQSPRVRRAMPVAPIITFLLLAPRSSPSSNNFSCN